MIAKFPDFSILDLEHRSEIEAITSRFEPFSDFNFVSLFCWNTGGSTKISILNSNLVINLPDYLTEEPVYSILGDAEIVRSLEAVLAITPILQMVPEIVVKKILHPEKFIIKEDENHFDYIYSLEDQAHFPDGKFKEKRKKANRFSRKYEGRYELIEIDFKNTNHSTALKETFQQWAEAKHKPENEVISEKKAIDRLIDNAASLNLLGLMIKVDGRSAGFSITELSSPVSAVYHFHKTLPRFDNLDVFLTRETAIRLKARGGVTINWEQDLGIAGLKSSKQSYKPIHLLKKFTVRSK